MTKKEESDFDKLTEILALMNFNMTIRTPEPDVYVLTIQKGKS